MGTTGHNINIPTYVFKMELLKSIGKFNFWFKIPPLDGTSLLCAFFTLNGALYRVYRAINLWI